MKTKTMLRVILDRLNVTPPPQVDISTTGNQSPGVARDSKIDYSKTKVSDHSTMVNAGRDAINISVGGDIILNLNNGLSPQEQTLIDLLRRNDSEGKYISKMIAELA